MAFNSSLYIARHRWSLDDLSSELLALIFEQLRCVDARSLAVFRLLSRRFDAIITPIKYEYLCLTERIIAGQALTHFPHALEKVYVHTRHVDARSDLNPEDTKRLLNRINRLLSVRWRYTTVEFRSGRLWMPADIFSLQNVRLNRTKLHVEGLPLRDFTGQLQDTYLNAIPTNMLVSLKMASPAPPLTTRLDSLKKLLLQSGRIETFHYDDRGQGTRFTFADNERLPAFRELALRSYDWNHSATDVQAHWDFTRIRILQLVDVPMLEFLVSVPFEDLLDLQALHCEDFSAHLPDRRLEATRGLYFLVRRIRALRTLKLTCHTQHFPVDAILSHARTLQVLRFRDHVGFGEDDRRCPTMWVDDLALLSRSLVNLHTLEIDMDVTLCEPPLFLRALCAFPRLRTLTLHIQTVLRVLEFVHPGADQDYDAAMRIFGALVRGKHGAPWRCITINVGGWKRNMVRRLGEAWREWNEMGIYAERCFVLEKGVGGELLVREEMGSESN
ncbi:F-box domain-containing protein [Pseudomassariella vexata]|uniref:F-box domain-containing protein n=1 Tax=Pseudomassariella vexata TaxID=1141098 RepID=A0A1Y2E7E4_9PEZI|nr:F-box domain-containing protein [Pseudomassariella vexata]ORY67459.1 F-box domain-containing protein [Pseudomassariella vexata]